MCSCTRPAGDDPPRRPRRVLRLGRAADDPSLRGRPVIVGAGVVLAASYEAKASACARRCRRQARRLCPSAVVVEPRMSAYTEASKAMFQVFDDTAPRSRACRSTRRSLTCAAWPHRRPPDRDRDAPAQRGAGAGRSADHGRRGAHEVPGQGGQRGGQAGWAAASTARSRLAFLHPLPVRRLWGVGPVTVRKLHEHGIATVARWRAREATLVSMFGQPSGRHLHALAHNRDPRPVVRRRRRHSIGAQRALGRRRKRRGHRRRGGAGRSGDPAAAVGRRICRTVACGCGSTTSPGRPGPHAAGGDLAHADDPADRGGVAAASLP